MAIPMALLKAGMDKFKGKDKKAPEGSKEEEMGESPKEEAKEVAEGKGDKADKTKKPQFPFPKGKK